MRRIVFPLILGLGGIAILVSLGMWQLRRLEWKEAMLADLQARLADAPGVLPAAADLDPVAQKYLPVTVAGRTTGEEILVLSGIKGQGAAYDVIAAFETSDGRRILLDRGLVAETDRDAARPGVALEISGNLHWPAEADSYTPPPDPKTGLWFARDTAAMAAKLGTEPVLVVVRTAEGPAQGITPVPLVITGIPNDHFGYALTWFGLALVWAGMTGYLLWRIRNRTV